MQIIKSSRMRRNMASIIKAARERREPIALKRGGYVVALVLPVLPMREPRLGETTANDASDDVE